MNRDPVAPLTSLFLDADTAADEREREFERAEIQNTLRDAEFAARQYLSQFEASVLVRIAQRKYQLRQQTADFWPHALPAEAPPEAHLAADMLRHLRELRSQLPKEPKLGQAVYLGMLCERLRRTARPQETWSSRSA